MSSHTPPCPYCGNARVSLNGVRDERQLYVCPRCRKQFRGGGAAFGHHFPPEVIGEAITHYYGGMSYRQVVEEMSNTVGDALLSRDTVHRWVTVYTEAALRRLDGVKASTFSSWYAVDMPVSLRDGKKWWAWFVLDLFSSFVLTCHLSRERNAAAAATALRMATSAAIASPLWVCSETCHPYDDALREAFPDATPKLVVPVPHTRWESQATQILPDPLVEVMQAQVKRAIRMRDLNRGILHLRGWLLCFNFMGAHRVALEGEPPGVQVGLSSYPSDWLSVAKLGPVA